MKHLAYAGGLAIGLLVGCAPKDIALAKCESIMLSTNDTWNCAVSAKTVGQSSSIAFDTESRNKVAVVDIALRVTKGTLRVEYQDLVGTQQLLITPETPASLTMKTKMHPTRRSFTMYFTPVNGVVEGLAGTVNYSTP